MKVYVTRYALTRSILIMKMTIVGDYFRNINTLQYYHKDECFESESEAIKDAQLRKEKKLIQLKNQIEKLEKKNVTTIKEV